MLTIRSAMEFMFGPAGDQRSELHERSDANWVGHKVRKYALDHGCTLGEADEAVQHAMGLPQSFGTKRAIAAGEARADALLRLHGGHHPTSPRAA